MMDEIKPYIIYSILRNYIIEYFYISIVFCFHLTIIRMCFIMIDFI